jgi:cob(I)alamin adenosyltransferase
MDSGGSSHDANDDKESDMGKGNIQIYCGRGHGKSPAALGTAVQRACHGETTVIIEFLKGKGLEESEYVKRLEPEIRIFRFEKSEAVYSTLSPEQQSEEVRNIQNGLNFARKIMNTDECDLLILDEVLGLIDTGIITADQLCELLKLQRDDMDLILTGITTDERLCRMADDVVRLDEMKGT